MSTDNHVIKCTIISELDSRGATIVLGGNFILATENELVCLCAAIKEVERQTYEPDSAPAGDCFRPVNTALAEGISVTCDKLFFIYSISLHGHKWSMAQEDMYQLNLKIIHHLQQYSYFTFPDSTVMPVEARPLGFSMIFAGCDDPHFEDESVV